MLRMMKLDLCRHISMIDGDTMLEIVDGPMHYNVERVIRRWLRRRGIGEVHRE